MTDRTKKKEEPDGRPRARILRISGIRERASVLGSDLQRSAHADMVAKIVGLIARAERPPSDATWVLSLSPSAEHLLRYGRTDELGEDGWLAATSNDRDDWRAYLRRRLQRDLGIDVVEFDEAAVALSLRPSSAE